jgi:hypothetical protein
MKAELFYKNNYCQKNEEQNNHNGVVINTEFSVVNYENIKTLFNATIRDDIEKTFITRTVVEDKENLLIETNDKESFAVNSHRGDYSYNLNTNKSGLISRRSQNNSIENILNNLDENFSNINERIIDKIQKNKKTVRNNYSTTDKTKPEENIFNTNAKLKQPLNKDDEFKSESKKIFTSNKSSHCLFNTTKMNNNTVRQVINPDYTLSRAKGIPQQKNKINIKLKYKDVKELLSDKSPLGEHENAIKFSSKINEYKDLNLKKNQINAFHYNKSCDPKNLEYSSKCIDQNTKKNHSTKISEKNKNSLFVNINFEKNLKEPVMNKATRNMNSINTLKSTLTIIPKKDRIVEKKIEDGKAENKIKDIINNPQLNITKSIFPNNIQSKSNMFISNNVNIASAKLLNKKEININNYYSHNNINTNSRNQVHSIYKNNSNFDLTNPESSSNKIRNKSKGKNNSIEMNKIEKLVYNSCINLQKGSGKIRLTKEKLQI